MRKIYLLLCISLLLFSCRLEEDLKVQEDSNLIIGNKFRVFTKKNATDTIDYARGFQTLALRYDSLYQKDYTGHKALRRISNIKGDDSQHSKPYTEFRVRTQTIRTDKGDKIVLFPKVQGRKVVELLMASLTRDETKLSYYRVPANDTIYKLYGSEFQKGLDALWIKNTSIRGRNNGGKERVTNIEEVVIVKIVPRSGGGSRVIELAMGRFDDMRVVDSRISNGICSIYEDCVNLEYDDLGGGGGESYPEEPDPCTKAKEGSRTAEKILKAPKVSEKMDKILKEKIDYNKTIPKPHEWAVSIGSDGQGNYEVSNPLEGEPFKGKIPSHPLKYYVGDGHIHNGTGVPSGGDLYGMLELMQGNKHFEVRFVYGEYGDKKETYALIIVDREQAKKFLATYPRSKYYDEKTHTFKEGTIIGEDFKIMRDIGYNGFYNLSEDYSYQAVSMAYILEKYNMGIALVKQGNEGGFKVINVKAEKYKDHFGGGIMKDGAVITICP